MAPSATPVIATVGAVRSISMPLIEAVAVLPALSMVSPLDDWPAPSLARVCGDVHEATPESASVQEKLTVTAALFHPAALAGVREATISGAPRSIRTVTAFDASTLPATSVAQYERLLFPSPVMLLVAMSPVAKPLPVWPSKVSAWSMRSTPESASIAVIVAVTSVLCQPLADASGESATVLSGAVLSVLRQSHGRFA